MSVKINGYQKIINAVQGIEMPSPPVALTLSLYGSKLTSCPAELYYRNASLYVKGQKAIVDLYDTDVVTTPFAFAYEGEVYGSTVTQKEKTPPQLRKPAISSHTEINSLKIPTYNAGAKAYFLDVAKMLVDNYKSEKFIVGNTLSCVDVCTMIMGAEGFMDTLLFHPLEAKLLMKKVSEHFIAYTNALFEIGVDAVVVPSTFTSHNLLPSKLIEELILPALQQAFQHLNGPILIHHGGTKIVKNLHYFDNLPNIAGFVIDDHENLAEARQKIGNKVLLGNMNIYNIAQKSAPDIQKKSLEILNNRKNDNNFVLMNSGPDVIYDTPHENVAIIFDTVRNYKRNAT